MSGISVPSRFSCLKIEDDEFRPVINKSNRKRSDSNSSKDPKLVKNNNAVDKTNPTKKASTKQITVTNGNCTTAKTSTKKKKSKHQQEVKQWEEWKRKDDEFVNENFEQDLRCAILQSKLEFENQKKNTTKSPQEKIKKKKPKPIPLDQFLESNNKVDSDKEKTEEVENDFFEEVINSAKEEVKKEQFEEKLRERNTNIEEVITLTQYQEKLKVQTEIIDQLKKELEAAKIEVAVVKSRNKTLCGMLCQGEMKDKAMVLHEFEKLKGIKEELGEEVARLHKLLEQERTSTKVNSSSSSTEAHGSKHKEKIQKKKH